MNAAEQLEAIIDLVLVNPFTKTTQIDVDGNKKYIYSPTTFPSVNLPCLTQIAGKIWMLFNFLQSALVQFEIWQPNKVYRKYQIVRYGLDDYIAIVDTVSIPTTQSDWALIRENIQGPAGESGNNIPILL